MPHRGNELMRKCNFYNLPAALPVSRHAASRQGHLSPVDPSRSPE